MDLQIDAAIMDSNVKELKKVAARVYADLGPGHEELIYHNAFGIYLDITGVPHVSEAIIPITYMGHPAGVVRPDMIVGGSIIVEFKAGFELQEVNRSQTKKYLRALDTPTACLINFPLVVAVGRVQAVEFERIDDPNHPFIKFKQCTLRSLLDMPGLVDESGATV